MKKLTPTIFIILGLAFLGVAIYYWVTSAGSLPHGFPGYEVGSSHKHFKHGLAAIILAVGSFVLAWFSSGKKSTSSEETEKS